MFAFTPGAQIALEDGGYIFHNVILTFSPGVVRMC